MSRIASSSEATFMTPTAGPNDCVRQKVRDAIRRGNGLPA